MVGTLRYPQRATSAAALSASIILHVLIVAGLYLAGFFALPEETIIRRTREIWRFPPPSIMPTDVAVTPRPAAGRVSEGLPVAVPDVEVSPDQTIADQVELREAGDGVGEQGSATDEIVIPEPPPSKEVDPPPFQVVEIPPKPVNIVQPPYPETARLARIEGTVWVNILVGADGKVRKAIVLKSEADIFNDVAIEAAMKWVFTPAIMNNGPVAFWASVPFKFRLSH
jgi:TonB family protein